MPIKRPIALALTLALILVFILILILSQRAMDTDADNLLLTRAGQVDKVERGRDKGAAVARRPVLRRRADRR